jgi:hypothetical protein
LNPSSAPARKYLYNLLTLCELFIPSQYGTGVLQNPHFELLTFSSWPRHAVIQYHMV